MRAGMGVEEITAVGPARLFALARVLLHLQVMAGMIGCLTFVCGTIHPG